MLKISTEIVSISRVVGEEKAVELVGKAGFDAWDLTMFRMTNYDWKTKKCMPNDHPFASKDCLNFVRKLREIGESYGMVCNQSHAPFPTACKEIRDTYKLALEMTAVAGGKVCIIHPDNNKSANENAEMYFELLDTAKSFGVKIATENMWNWDYETNIATPAACSSPKSFVEHLNAVDSDYFVACLDIGHAEMKGLDTSAPEMINALGNKLQALHIHDNDKIHDSHLVPFSHSIDFDAIAKALKQNNYNGYLTLEADAHMRSFAPENAFDGVKQLYDAAKRFALMVENA